MEIKEKKISGVYEITLKPIIDERGFFSRSYDINEFNSLGINRLWVQENHSATLKANTIRGLHFQLPPYSETKLIRCVRGAILDVYVDLRSNSKTFGVWETIELSAENLKMLYIPRGFAHGFCTLTDNSEVIYKVDNYYSKDYECGIIWNDIDLGIQWNCQNPILSEKDKQNITLKIFSQKFKGILV